MKAPIVVAVLAAAGVAVFVVTRPKWRVVEGASLVPWSRVFPDMGPRLAADPSALDVAVQVEPRQGGGERRLMRVHVVAALGDQRMRGVVRGLMPGEAPAAWAPEVGASIVFRDADVMGFA